MIIHWHPPHSQEREQAVEGADRCQSRWRCARFSEKASTGSPSTQRWQFQHCRFINRVTHIVLGPQWYQSGYITTVILQKRKEKKNKKQFLLFDDFFWNMILPEIHTVHGKAELFTYCKGVNEVERTPWLSFCFRIRLIPVVTTTSPQYKIKHSRYYESKLVFVLLICLKLCATGHFSASHMVYYSYGKSKAR